MISELLQWAWDSSLWVVLAVSVVVWVMGRWARRDKEQMSEEISTALGMLGVLVLRLEGERPIVIHGNLDDLGLDGRDVAKKLTERAENDIAEEIGEWRSMPFGTVLTVLMDVDKKRLEVRAIRFPGNREVVTLRYLSGEASSGESMAFISPHIGVPVAVSDEEAEAEFRQLERIFSTIAA